MEGLRHEHREAVVVLRLGVEESQEVPHAHTHGEGHHRTGHHILHRHKVDVRHLQLGVQQRDALEADQRVEQGVREVVRHGLKDDRDVCARLVRGGEDCERGEHAWVMCKLVCAGLSVIARCLLAGLTCAHMQV